MALDPKFRGLLDMPEMQLGRPPAGVTAPMMREATRAMRPDLPPVAMHDTRNVIAPGPGGALPIRIYYPSSIRPLPVIYFIHGGGFVVCDVDHYDLFAQMLAKASGCAVASVEYRLAPECPFPGPAEDGYAGLAYLAREGAALGLDPARIAICGDSAGGNLAIATALLARDRGGPALAHMALLYPVTDAACDSASMREFATGYMLSRDIMVWFWECYLARPEDGEAPLASPLRHAQLAGLPPSTVITAEYDVLRDEGEAFADKLRAAGISVISRRYLGMIHGFASMPNLTEVAERALTDIGRDLRAALAGPADAAEAHHLAVAQRLYGAALTGDFATAATLMAPDCVIPEASALPFAGTYVGVEGLQSLFVKISGLLAMKDVRIHPMLAAGDLVVTPIEIIVDDQGQDAIVNVVELLRFRDGKVVELVPYYYDAAQVTALAARRT